MNDLFLLELIKIKEKFDKEKKIYSYNKERGKNVLFNKR